MHFFVINNCGDLGKIVDLIDSAMDSYSHINFYRCVNDDLGEYVREVRRNNKYAEFFVEKSKLGFEGAYITKEDIIIKEINKLDYEKGSVFSTIRGIVNSKISAPDLLALYRFCVLNNYFINQGIILTRENMQQKLTEFIDLNDSEKVKHVEEYIEVVKDLELVHKWYQVYSSTLRLIDSAESVEEVSAIFSNFLSQEQLMH